MIFNNVTNEDFAIWKDLTFKIESPWVTTSTINVECAPHTTHDGGGGTAEWRWKTNDTFFQFFTLLFFFVIFLSFAIRCRASILRSHQVFNIRKFGSLSKPHYDFTQNMWVNICVIDLRDGIRDDRVGQQKIKMCTLWTESYGEKNWQEPAVNYDWVAQSARPMYSLRFNYLERFGGLFCLLSRQHRMSGPFPSTTTWNVVLSKIIREELPVAVL